MSRKDPVEENEVEKAKEAKDVFNGAIYERGDKKRMGIEENVGRQYIQKRQARLWRGD